MRTGIALPYALSFIVLLTALADLILGSLVLIDSPRRKINRLYALLSVVISASGISYLGVHFSRGTEMLEAWSYVYTASLLFGPPLYYHMILGSIGYPLQDYNSRLSVFCERVKQLAYVFSAGWLALTISGVFPQPLRRVDTLTLAATGQHVWIAVLFFLGVILFSVQLLVRSAFLAQDQTHRSRLLYLLVGTVTVAIVAILGVIHGSSAFFGKGITAFLVHLGPTAMLAFIAYALTTTHLYHFSEILRKTIAFLVMTAILLSVFGGTHALSRKLLAPYVPNSEYVALAIASVLMALLFHPLRFRVQNMVDRVFFAKRYDQMQRLRGLSRRVLSSADREELLSVLFTSLKGIGFGSLTLLLKDPQKPIFHVRKQLGLNASADGFFLRNDSLLIQYLREEKSELIREDVTRRIMADWERQSLNDEMEILNADICFPLFSTRRRALFGIITLGQSELGYSSFQGRNIFWLKAVVDNAGIMLDNFYHQEFANAIIPYVGRTWADEIRRNKEGFRERLAGHRTWVSVLMVDIRHFTTVCAHMDPREVVDLLKEFRARVAPIVYRYQGTIDKFIGDAIMIVFGLPILPKLPNPDQNAVECALAIMQEIQLMSAKRFEAGKREGISIGIGVSSGEVIAGNVDSGDRVEYTVIGDAANMVARLEDKAGDNQILLSPATYARVRDNVTVNTWPAQMLSGFDEPMAIYELLGANHAAATANPPRADNPPPLNQIAANQ